MSGKLSSRRGSLVQRALHSYRRLVLHIREHVGVGVHRLRDRRVAQHLLDDLRVYIFGEQQRGARVPQGVEGEAQIRKIRFPE